jgi:hypothetical protein
MGLITATGCAEGEDACPAEEALALIIDVACEMGDRTYFRSEDPVEAARFVVSGAAALLWEKRAWRADFGAAGF